MKYIHRITLSLSLFIALPGLLFAQSDVEFPIYSITNVSISAQDGRLLPGTMYRANSPGPAVLLFHQFGTGQRWDYERLATMLTTHGFHVLAIDIRGHGDNSYEGSDDQVEGNKVIGDADVAFEWLVRQQGVVPNKIGTMGASGSVGLAMHLAVTQPSIQAVVALSGHASQEELQFLGSTNSPAIFGAGSLADDMMVRFEGEFTKVTGAAVTGMMADRSSHPSSTHREFQDSGHGTDMFAREPGLENDIVGWFVDVIGQ